MKLSRAGITVKEFMETIARYHEINGDTKLVVIDEEAQTAKEVKYLSLIGGSLQLNVEEEELPI